ncbi:recombinase family protein [Salinibacillus xinjiangensis]|uniref:Recombinase family protein n=1 Tax=Salinibacillus xinjiangensis TaxID=1229268 RepID=A0A6G1X7T1_9BACI|nr:recombinase family protein [Salinibacillus xinjiangensis]MRG86966.1 recombinase family protein [Salinibacillus xinjiangensis]
MKTGIYIRVSTDEQAKHGYSISAQRERLKAYCVSQGWDIVGFYVDEGISAKDTNRPELKRMLKDIETGEIECVLVYKLDRLTRSVLDLYKLLESFEKYGCKFESATEVYETSTAMGRMFITLVAALAQFERENMAERISMGLQEKARQGKYTHNQRPFGYTLKDGVLSLKDDEAEIVRLIFRLYLDGKGANSVCKYLNARNITTRDGNTWNDKPLIQLLRNPTYKGTATWLKGTENEIMIEDAHPPIIDKETFERVQKTIEKRRGLSPMQIYSDHIFSGKLKCNKCGYSLTGYRVYTKNAKGEKVSYKNYRCLHKKTGQCSGVKTISERKLEKQFIHCMKKINLENEAKEVSVSNIKAEDKSAEIKQAEKDLKEVEKRKKKWQYAWANNMGMSDSDFEKRMREENKIEEEAKAILSNVQSEENVSIDREEFYRTLQEFTSNWNNLDDRNKKNLVQIVVKNIEYDYDENKEFYIKNVEFY